MLIAHEKDKSAEVLVIRVDCSGVILQIIYCDKKISRVGKKLQGKNLENIGLQELLYKRCEKHLQQLFLNSQTKRFQLFVGKKKYQISYLPEGDRKRQVETVLVIISDITQEDKKTEELEKNNKIFMAKQASVKMAGKIAKLGYFKWDRITGDLYYSDQQYRNFGYHPQEVIPTVELFCSQIHPDDFQRLEKGMREVYKKTDSEFQFRVIRADGVVGWLYLRMNLIVDEAGNSTKIFGITQDITEQKKAEERINRVEKELAFTNELYSRSAYLNKLLFNSYSPEYIRKELNEFGINTNITYCCFVLQLTDKLVDKEDLFGDRITPPIVRKQAVLIWLAEKKWGIVWRCHDNIVLLTSNTDRAIATKYSQIEFADEIITELEQVFPRFHVKIGISGMSNIPVDFRGNYEKAHRAVSIPTITDYSSATHYEDIGFYEVAFKLLQDENTCLMVETTIGRLAEYDEGRGSNLLTTLECILENVSLKTVAQELFVHYNTVLWRKRRIEAFLEMSLDKMETKMLLMIYIKIWNLKRNIL